MSPGHYGESHLPPPLPPPIVTHGNISPNFTPAPSPSPALLSPSRQWSVKSQIVGAQDTPPPRPWKYRDPDQ